MGITPSYAIREPCMRRQCRRDVRGAPASLQDVASDTRAFYLMTSGRLCAHLSSHASAWKARSRHLLFDACTAGLVAACYTCVTTRWALHGSSRLRIAAVSPRRCGTTAVSRASNHFSLQLCLTAGPDNAVQRAENRMRIRDGDSSIEQNTWLAGVRVSAFSGCC